MLMTLNNFKTERYQRKRNIRKKKGILKKKIKLKAFQNIVAIFKVNSMIVPKALETILVNSSTNPNLKTKTLLRKLERILIKL